MKKTLASIILAGSLFLSQNAKTEELAKPTTMESMVASEAKTPFATPTEEVLVSELNARLTPVSTVFVQSKRHTFGKRVPIIYLHQVYSDREPGSKIHTTVTRLNNTLNWLYENQFYLVSLEDLVNDTMKVPKGKMPFVITADDYFDQENLTDCYETFIKQHPDFGKGMTFFVLAESKYFGKGKDDFELLIEKYKRLGISIQGHGVSHKNLRNATADQVRYQIEEAQRKFIEYGLKPFTLFAYPYGEWPRNPEVLKVIKDMMAKGTLKAAFVTDGEPCKTCNLDERPERVSRFDGAQEKELYSIIKAYRKTLYTQQ